MTSAERRRRAGLLLGPRPLFHRIPIPAGLERTLEDLSREVLRHQPEDVYRFCADFFHSRLTARQSESSERFLSTRPPRTIQEGKLLHSLDMLITNGIIFKLSTHSPLH